MSATPTPTPWRAEPSPDTQWVVKADSQWICNTLHGNDEANARLIVTAVNHFEDLLEIVRALDGCIVPPAIAIKARQLLARLDGAEREQGEPVR